jgi:hypothetical protein
VGWEFYGQSAEGFGVMPDPDSWKKDGPDTVTLDDDETRRFDGDTLPPDEADEQDALASDLQALQQMMSMPAELTNLPDAPAQPPKRSRSS